jgi:hypothetical protein
VFGFHAAGDGLKGTHRSHLALREVYSGFWPGAFGGASFGGCETSNNWLDCVQATF